MTEDTGYTPPKVWTWDKENGGAWASLNRPIAGATHDKELPVGKHPFQLYSMGTPNGVKVTVMFEELLAAGHDAEYDAWLIKIGDGDQFGSGFVEINPNSKIPALMDRSGDKPVRVFESGAILMYLAEKTGKFMPQEMAARYDVIQWLMFQMGGIGPIFGQVHHFKRAAKEQVPYAIERYMKECLRLYGVLDRRLDGRPYLAGAELSIADFATLPWVFRHDWQEVDLSSFANVKRWYDELMARPAVQRGMDVPAG